jgi:hypothetical protein
MVTMEGFALTNKVCFVTNEGCFVTNEGCVVTNVQDTFMRFSMHFETQTRACLKFTENKEGA